MLAERLAQAEAHFVAGRFDAVAEICGALIETDPKCHQAYYLLGRTCMTVGREGQAREMIERAVQIEETAAPYHTELGNVLAAAGDFAAAAECYRKAIALAPDFIDPYVNLGAALRLLGRVAESVEIYGRAVVLAPEAAMLHYGLGEALLASGALDEAVNAYAAAAELEPEWPELHRRLGTALVLSGDGVAAVGSCRKAINLAPADPESHIALAHALLCAGDPRGALATCDAFMASHPYHGGLVACRAMVLNELGSRAAAERLLGLKPLVQMAGVTPPVAYGTIEGFNEALAEEADAHPHPEFDPARMIACAGRQTGALLSRPGPAGALLLERIDGAVRAYIESLPDDPNHPLVMNAPGSWQISGWALDCDGAGFREPHIRPDGWLSGYYGVVVPAGSDAAAEESSIPLEFGTPPPSWPGAAEPIVSRVRLCAGEMLLFPSFLYHRILPFDGGETCRLYGFDVIGQA